MKARWTLILVCVGLATLVAFPVAQADHDDGNQLVGTWRVTDDPDVGEFFAFLVFNKGNTLTERNALSRGISMSSGVWKKIPGRGNFATTLESFNDDDLDGVFDTRALVRQTIHVEGDTLFGTGIGDWLTLDGKTPLFRFSGRFKATRMTVIPE